VLRYADVRAGQQRSMRLRPDGRLQAFLLAGDARAQAWVLDLLQQDLPAADFGRALLAASPRPPQPVAPRSPQVCACHDVSEERIVTALGRCVGDAGMRLREVQAQLRCGTECGSCVPALKALEARQAALAGAGVASP
jgi:assimilatory nitrate reductase catalytic subunit